MKKFLFCILLLCSRPSLGAEHLVYHDIQVDQDGLILPWYDSDLAKSYDHMIHLVWNFWDNMKTDPNGLPVYMNHQIWRDDHDDYRGIGGDQLQMALSSWRLLYAYTGEERIKQNMRFMADYYLTHSLSPANCVWANLPFSYNSLIYSGQYDGDMVIGPGFLQPDKAGSLGIELIHLFKMTSKDSSIQTIPQRYLQASIQIAQSLAKHIVSGDDQNSPLPFKVNVFTGEIGGLYNSDDGTIAGVASYTTNWAPSMELFLELESLDPQNKPLYEKSFGTLLSWMKTYPMRTNRWGPFFEDIQGWSDTQINATTFAWFILEHPEYFPNWKTDVENIFDWTYKILGNNDWSQYGVTVVNEQTGYKFPGQSHVSRQASAELKYSRMTGNESRKAGAIRQLSWATYMVDNDGKSLFPGNENWLTDGYGDFVRHYLRSMAEYPELTPAEDHVLSSTSVITLAAYGLQNNAQIFYRTYDSQGTEIVRLAKQPKSVLLNGIKIEESTEPNSFNWTPLAKGGFLTIRRARGADVLIVK